MQDLLQFNVYRDVQNSDLENILSNIGEIKLFIEIQSYTNLDSKYIYY